MIRFIRQCMVLLAVFIATTGALQPSYAQNPHFAVLLEQGHEQESLNNLLYTLKQVDNNYATIQIEELRNNKGFPIIVPIDQGTSETFLTALSTQVPETTRLILVPVMGQSNPAFDRFLIQRGYTAKGVHVIRDAKYLSLMHPLEHINTSIPASSLIINATSNEPLLAAWGKYSPAVVPSGNTLLLNWNWSKPLSPTVFNMLLNQWAPMHEIVIATPSQSEPRTLANADTKSTDGLAFQAVETDNADVTPPELYEFNVTTRPDKETIRRRRSKDTQNALAEYYNDRMRELSNIYDMANTKCVKLLHHPQKHKECTHLLDEYSREKSTFENHWFYHRYPQALGAYLKSRQALHKILFDNIPTSNVEGRAIWLDRGSIVDAGSPEKLRLLIRRIAASGFNVIYFETVNAGYALYPSKVTKQSPQINGWDPLKVAVEEAHQQGVELHAWVWVFAVGNKRLNKILEVPDSFAGPVLTNGYMSEAMRGSHGQLVPARQHEYWLSPASFKARRYLIGLFSEVVQNYDVDGLQLDYIRYPFQNSRQNMGVEAAGRFRAETGLGAGNRSEFSRKAWSAWRAFQVSTFVRDTSKTLKRIDPDLQLSAAVFPMSRYGRMMMIQQDWETWVRNGWIDTIIPMAYSRSPRSLERLVQYVHNIGDDKTLVYPGLSLIRLNAIEMLDSMEIARNTGVMGTTLFAFAHFDQDKQLVLQSGPYRGKRSIPPHRDPVYASIQLASETKAMIDNLMIANDKLPGQEVFQSMHDRMASIQNKLRQLEESKDVANRGFLITSVRDESVLLKQEAEQWVGWSKDDRLLHYQAKALQQMVDKTVRIIRYTAYQLGRS